MNTFSAMEITASGLSAQRTRINVVSGNLANAQTTRTAQGGPYKRKDPVFQSEVVRVNDKLEDDFEKELNNLENDSLQNNPLQQDENLLEKQIKGVKVVDIVADNSPPRMVYAPNHPDANAQGYVAMPNVNVVEEMVNMISASRAYEAGVTTMQTVKTIARQAISIGR